MIDKAYISKLPDTPGVYFFKKEGDILYIGKATSIRDRVRSYFSGDILQSRSPLIQRMINEAHEIDYQETDSVLEALILEANVIKKYQPPYNTKEKDNKSFKHVVFTNDEYPRVFTVRGKDLTTLYDPDEFKYVFGPFPSGGSLKEALKIIRKIFPYRGEKDPVEDTLKVSPLKRQIGLVPDFSVVSKKEYQNTILNLKLFFEGKKKRLVSKLEKEMNVAAKNMQFEEAEDLKRKIFALTHINDIALIKDEYITDTQTNIRIESFDIAHMGNTNRVGVMVVVEDGFPNKTQYRKFKIKEKDSKGDTGALKEVLERRLEHTEWPYPNLFVVDGGKAQLNLFKEVLTHYGIEIPVVSVVKNEKHMPKDILGDKEYRNMYEREILIANQEAHRFAMNYHRQLRRRNM